MINEQELAEAVERLREGETVMGVSFENLIVKMAENRGFCFCLLSKLCDNESAQVMFEEEFNDVARYELREVIRTHKEQQAGLM